VPWVRVVPVTQTSSPGTVPTDPVSPHDITSRSCEVSAVSYCRDGLLLRYTGVPWNHFQLLFSPLGWRNLGNQWEDGLRRASTYPLVLVSQPHTPNSEKQGPASIPKESHA
jgi:hypothetical protein